MLTSFVKAPLLEYIRISKRISVSGTVLNFFPRQIDLNCLLGKIKPGDYIGEDPAANIGDFHGMVKNYSDLWISIILYKLHMNII